MTSSAERGRQYRKTKKEAAGRRCDDCSIILSVHNLGKLCAQCQRLTTEVRATEDIATRERIAARKIVGIYARPESYPNVESYLAALSEGLDELTRIVGPTPPASTLDGTVRRTAPRTVTARRRRFNVATSVERVEASDRAAVAEMIQVLGERVRLEMGVDDATSD